MSQENSSVALFNQENDLVDASKIQEMTVDFSKQIDELDKAIQLTKDAGELASRVQEKGMFGTLLGSFNGSNDKQLAESVKILGASVETTQKIIEVILKVNNVKNQYLKSFHSALTDKILTMSKEMDVSYGNQKNAKQASITIATQLRAQIEEKIKHSEMIDEHEDEISQLQNIAQSKDILDDDQSTAILELKEKALLKDDLDHQQSQAINSINEFNSQNEAVDQQQTRDIEALKEIASNKDKIDNQQSNEIHKLKGYTSSINLLIEKQALEIQFLKEQDIQNGQNNDKQYEEINSLRDKIKVLQNAIELTTDNFTNHVSTCNSLAYKLKNSALPLLALLMASIAIYFALH